MPRLHVHKFQAQPPLSPLWCLQAAQGASPEMWGQPSTWIKSHAADWWTHVTWITASHSNPSTDPLSTSSWNERCILVLLRILGVGGNRERADTPEQSAWAGPCPGIGGWPSPPGHLREAAKMIMSYLMKHPLTISEPLTFLVERPGLRWNKGRNGESIATSRNDRERDFVAFFFGCENCYLIT